MSTITLSVITSGAFAAALKLLAPMYEKKSGRTVQLSFGSSMGTAPDSIPTRLAKGEVFDVLVLAGPALDLLIQVLLPQDQRLTLQDQKWLQQ